MVRVVRALLEVLVQRTSVWHLGAEMLRKHLRLGLRVVLILGFVLSLALWLVLRLNLGFIVILTLIVSMIVG